MNAALKEILQKKCNIQVKSVESFDEDEGEEEFGETLYDLGETETIELPLEDKLADKRRKYSAKEEFVFLLYNDLLHLFVKEWDGRVLRKKPKKIDDSCNDRSADEEEEEEEEEVGNIDHEQGNKGDTEVNNDSTNKNMSESNSGLFWKVTVPDEFANITFINNNTYSGRISRKMMEGKGVYRWSNGAQYKGDFEQNRMHGKGLLEWSSERWYEGDFANGYRHGRGIIVNGERRYMYTGKWYMGKRHGKGYCRYGDSSSYEGDWVMDKMEGIGTRTYAKSGCYFGQWKNGLRHGKGTMVWSNGDIYRGEWECGVMHGYGRYVWKGFFNKTFTWPQEASYVGQWRNGMRHGEGELKLNTVGGAKYTGYWKDNQKHGYGVIIGSNGEKFESNPLFLNDVLCASNAENSSLIDDSETTDEVECVRVEKEMEPIFVEKPDQLEEAFKTPVLKPEQIPSLSYHIIRLLHPKSLESPCSSAITSGKCYSCEDEYCACLAMNSIDSKEQDANKKGRIDIHNPVVNETMRSDWEHEEQWVHNCLTLHMARLRQIYNDYARLFTTSAPTCNLTMSRLCLWQMWRDCGIHKKGLTLIEIDNYISKNETTFMKNPSHPFERIEIWQFLHALLEVSWHLYTKHDDIEKEEINGKLAGGLHRLLKNDIFPHAGNHIGTLCHEYQDLLPVVAVYKLCENIGYPFSAKELFRTMCVLNDTRDVQPFVAADEAIKNFPKGINCVTMGEDVNYLLQFDEIFMKPYCTFESTKNNEHDLSRELLVFGELGTTKVLEIMTLICPGIKDAETDTIINMDYMLTFLEFYEIILEATKQLLSIRKEARKELQAKEIEGEDVALQSNNLQKQETTGTVRRSFTKRTSKIKKR